MDRQPIHNERRGAFGVSQNGKIKEDSRPLEDHLFSNQRVEWWTIVPVLAVLVLLLLAIVVVVDDECLGYLFVTFSFTITCFFSRRCRPRRSLESSWLSGSVSLSLSLSSALVNEAVDSDL
jgi:hypothetical protein